MQAAHIHGGVVVGIVREGGADTDLDVLGGALAHHQVVHLLEIDADGVTEFVASHPHRLAQHGATQAEHRHFSGAASDINNHGANRLGDGQTGADGGRHRLID